MRHQERDFRGRWAKVDTELAHDERSDHFPQSDLLDVGFPSDVHDGPYEMVPGDYNMPHAPAAPRVDYAGPGTGAPLRSRNPELVHADELADDTRDIGNELLRSAARDSGRWDPSYSLVAQSDRPARLMGVPVV